MTHPSQPPPPLMLRLALPTSAWCLLTWRRAALALFVLLSGGCDGDGDGGGLAADPEGPELTGSAVAPHPEAFVLPPQRPHDSNPLGLPPAIAEVEKGARVFAVPPRMLRDAKEGSALALRAATMLGRDGDDLVLRVGNGAPYAVHPGYVVTLPRARFRRQGAVIAAYRGRLKHGVVKGFIRDRVMVRYTDLGFKIPDQKLKRDRVGVLPGGLSPGAYAVHRTEREARHVLLVSEATHPGGKRMWLTFGYSGEARLVESAALTALPTRRFEPKVGATVLAAWRGVMVMARVREIDRPALYKVARPRTSTSLLVGPSMIMAPDRAATE